MAEGTAPYYVLQNYGTRRNCTLTAAFMAVISIDSIEVGGTKGNVNYDVSSKSSRQATIFTEFSPLKCDQTDSQDKVTVGGSNGLDSHHFTKATAICGKTELNGPEQAILCGVTSVRLESSGKFNNKVVVALRQADENDASLVTAICDL